MPHSAMANTPTGNYSPAIVIVNLYLWHHKYTLTHPCNSVKRQGLGQASWYCRVVMAQTNPCTAKDVDICMVAASTWPWQSGVGGEWSIRTHGLEPLCGYCQVYICGPYPLWGYIRSHTCERLESDRTLTGRFPHTVWLRVVVGYSLCVL